MADKWLMNYDLEGYIRDIDWMLRSFENTELDNLDIIDDEEAFEEIRKHLLHAQDLIKVLKDRVA